jgi:uncharacterized protein YeaO (DUF488 family)
MISVEKSIYDPKSPDDGLRVLVMRYWPRGIKRNRVDIWFRDLGTSPELIKAWRSGTLSWVEFRQAYLAEVKGKGKQDIIRKLAKRAKTEKLTLLCSCRDHTRCHRGILKQLIERVS